MADKEYEPPKVWTWNKESAGRFAAINRPIAGPTHDKDMPVGKHPLQLYSLGTPNGVKVTILLEELLAKGYAGAEYDASILLYLAEKFGEFLPKDPRKRTEAISWLFWQMGSAPLLGGGFGHFYAYAPIKIEYAIDRYAMEVKRQLDVLDRHLAENEYMAGDEYSIADMAIWPWYGAVVLGVVYNAGEFLSVHEYKNVLRWTKQIGERPAVKRGRMVNSTNGKPENQLRERHDASDFETKTQDKLEAKA
jgi:GST-like protein